MTAHTPVISVSNLKKYYEPRAGLGALFNRNKKDSGVIKAVDEISFEIMPGEIFALVGESGSGKTTTGQLCIRALEPTAGSVIFNGTDLTRLKAEQLRQIRAKLQMIYQDPFDSIDPRFTIFDVIAEGVRAHSLANSEDELRKMVKDSLDEVGLSPADDIMSRHPHQLSGGQRQRVAFARAAVLHPQFVVADEPVSMLDVSIKADVLNNMLKLRADLGISFLFITHDLSWARHVADRIAVMYLGKIVEMTSADELVKNPLHPYTQALIAATPVPDPEARPPAIVAKGEIPSAIDVPPGCSFHPRCPYVFERCKTDVPKLLQTERGHFVSCHLVNK
ncbi:MAG: ABC transporter ATP-binding protein [Nitrososphaerota archaeon]|nr:ABC transporter ATP-binding protein [Nitrososphaerota archaeon]